MSGESFVIKTEVDDESWVRQDNDSGIDLSCQAESLTNDTPDSSDEQVAPNTLVQRGQLSDVEIHSNQYFTVYKKSEWIANPGHQDFNCFFPFYNNHSTHSLERSEESPGEDYLSNSREMLVEHNYSKSCDLEESMVADTENSTLASEEVLMHPVSNGENCSQSEMSIEYDYLKNQVTPINEVNISGYGGDEDILSNVNYNNACISNYPDYSSSLAYNMHFYNTHLGSYNNSVGYDLNGCGNNYDNSIVYSSRHFEQSPMNYSDSCYPSTSYSASDSYEHPIKSEPSDYANSEEQLSVIAEQAYSYYETVSGELDSGDNKENEIPAEEVQKINSKYTHQRFPLKLWNLASDLNFKPIRWSSDGMSLVIDEYALEPLLGYFFRSKKFSSFLRQLHLYGFRKVTRARNHRSYGYRYGESKSRMDCISEYQCAFFQRDSPHLVKNVRRFYPNQSNSSAPQDSPSCTLLSGGTDASSCASPHSSSLTASLSPSETPNCACTYFEVVTSTSHCEVALSCPPSDSSHSLPQANHTDPSTNKTTESAPIPSDA